MKRKMADRRSAFRKYLILFMISILLPTVIFLSFYIYNKYRDAVEQAELVSENALDRHSRNLNLMLDQLNQLSLQISLTPNVLELVTHPFDMQAYQYAEVKSQLRSWMTSNSLFESIYLDILQNGKVLTVNEGLYKKEDFYDRDFLNSFSDSAGYSMPWVGVRDHPEFEEGVLSLVKPVPATRTTSLGHLVFNIRKDTFMITLQGLLPQSAGQVMAVDPQGRLVSEPVEGMPVETIIGKITPGKFYRDTVVLSGKEFKLTGMQDSSSGWTLLQWTPAGSYQPEVTGAVRQALFILLGVLMAGIGLSYLFALMLYDPWRRLAVSLQSYVLAPAVNSRDAYTVVDQAIHHLINAIRQNEPIVRNHVVHEILHNHHPEDRVAASRLSEAGIAFPFPHYAVLSISANAAPGKEHSAAETLYLFSLAEEELTNRYATAGTIVDRGVFAFILNVSQAEVDAEFRTELEACCRSIVQRTASRLSADLTFAVSGIMALDVLHEGYEQVKRAMVYKALIPLSDVYFVSESDESQSFQYPASYQRKIWNAILAEDPRGTEQYVSELFDAYVRNSGYPYPKLLQMIMMLMSHILSSLVERGYDVEPLMDQVDLLRLQHCRNWLELREVIVAQFLQIIQYLVKIRNQAECGNPSVKLAVEYMKTHFAGNMTMADIAEHIGISPSHLSRVFKEETGKSPLEYVTELRLEMSKRLLRDRKIPLREVGRLIGYNDAHTFIRSFKKAEGMTPGEYRKKVVDHS